MAHILLRQLHLASGRIVRAPPTTISYLTGSRAKTCSSGEQGSRLGDSERLSDISVAVEFKPSPQLASLWTMVVEGNSTLLRGITGSKHPAAEGAKAASQKLADANLLAAMTADRDKWMMHSQELLAKVRQRGWITEAQLRAAVAVASRRADDEALHAKQQLAKLRTDFQTHQEYNNGKLQDAFQALLSKQDALRADLRDSMLLEVSKVCQKHFGPKQQISMEALVALQTKHEHLLNSHTQHQAALSAAAAENKALLLERQALLSSQDKHQAALTAAAAAAAENKALLLERKALLSSQEQQQEAFTAAAAENKALLLEVQRSFYLTLDQQQLSRDISQRQAAEEVQKAQAATAALSQELSTAQAEHKTLLLNAHTDTRRAELELQKAQSDVAALSQELSAAHAEQAWLHTEAQRLKHQADAEMQKAQSATAALSQELSTAQPERDRLRTEAQRLKHQAEAEVQKAQSATAALSQELSTEVQTLKQHASFLIQDIFKQRSTAFAELDALQLEHQVLLQQRDSAVVQIAELRQQLEEASSVADDHEALQRQWHHLELGTQQQQQQQQRDSLTKLRSDYALVCNENDALHDEVLHLGEQLSSLKPRVKKTVSRLHSEVARLKESNRKAGHQLHSAHHQLVQHKAAAEAAAGQHDKKYALLVERLSTLQARYDTALADATRQAEVFDDYREQYDGDAQLRDHEYEHLKKQSSAAIQEVDEQLQQAKQQIEELKKQAQHAQQQMQGLQQQGQLQLHSVEQQAQHAQQQQQLLEQRLTEQAHDHDLKLSEQKKKLEEEHHLATIFAQEEHLIEEERYQCEQEALAWEAKQAQQQLSKLNLQAQHERAKAAQQAERAQHELDKFKQQAQQAQQELIEASSHSSAHLRESETQNKELQSRAIELEQRWQALVALLNELHQLTTSGKVSAEGLLEIFSTPFQDGIVPSQGFPEALTGSPSATAGVSVASADDLGATAGTATSTAHGPNAIAGNKDTSLDTTSDAPAAQDEAFLKFGNWGYLSHYSRKPADDKASRQEPARDVEAAHTGQTGEAGISIHSDDTVAAEIPIQTVPAEPHLQEHSLPMHDLRQPNGSIQIPVQANSTPAGSALVIVEEEKEELPTGGAAAQAKAGVGEEEEAAPEEAAFAAEPEAAHCQDGSEHSRAAAIQQALREHPQLTLTAALDIGARAYASVLEGCDMSTQDVILSMLESDASFRELLISQCQSNARTAWMPCHTTWALSEHGIDMWELEVAVAGLLQHAGSLDSSVRASPLWSKTAGVGPTAVGLGADEPAMQEWVCMITPPTSDPVSDLALRTVYQYWGIPCVPHALL